MDAKNVLKRLKGESDKARKSVYLSSHKCDRVIQISGTTLSEILEALMDEFIEDYDKKKPKSKATKKS